MNSKLLLSLITATFLVVVNPALATDTPTPTPTTRLRQEIRENRQEVKTELKDNRQILHTTITQTRADFNKKRITITQQGLLTAFTARFGALEKYQTMIQTRLTTKLAKFPGNQNLTYAQTKLTEVTNNLIPKYNTDYAAFKAKFDQIAASTDPKTLVPDLKTLAKTVETDLKNIRAELVASLRLVIKTK